MEQLKKIVGINLGIMLIYTILMQAWAQLSGGTEYMSIGVLIFSMYIIAAHVAINLAIAIGYFFKSNHDMGKAFLLSTLIVLLVGFSSCWGNAVLSEVV